jgi:hypothetical protein
VVSGLAAGQAVALQLAGQPAFLLRQQEEGWTLYLLRTVAAVVTGATGSSLNRLFLKQVSSLGASIRRSHTLCYRVHAAGDSFGSSLIHRWQLQQA